MSRFTHTPKPPPDADGLVREKVTDFLLARARNGRMRDEQLRGLGLSGGDVASIVEDIALQLEIEDQIESTDLFGLDPEATIDTVGDLIDAVDKSLAALKTGGAP